jgi:transcriptional regulator with XRE-family HTH domain
METEKSYFEELDAQYGNLTFGSLLKTWRKEEQFTETDFAQKLDIPVEDLLSFEEEIKIPKPSEAAQIARKLSVPEADLIDLALRDSFKKESLTH